MKEKHNVIEGFAPKPMRKSPMPSMFIYFENATKMIAKVAIPHAIFKANFAPKLSAMKGMTKKPTKEPTNIMS